MSDAYTPNLDLILMAPTTHLNSWGTELNGNFSDIDAKVLPLTGGTMTGALVVTPPASGVTLTGVTGTAGGVAYSPILALDSNWGQISYLQAYHQSGIKAGLLLAVGTTALKAWEFGSTGTLTAPGTIAIPQAAQLNLGGGASLSHEGNGNLILTKVPGYYMGRIGSNGDWVWVDNNVATMTLSNAGYLWVKGSAGIAGTVNTSHVALPNDGHVNWAADYSFITRVGAGHLIFQATPEWRMYWDATDGGWRWQSGVNFVNEDMRLQAANLTVRGAINAGYTMSCTRLTCPEIGMGSHVWTFLWAPTPHGHAGIDWWVDGVNQGKQIFPSNIQTFSMDGAGFNTRDYSGTYWSVTMNVSDQRRKQNFAPVEGNSLAIVNALTLRAFDYIGMEDHTAAGLTAQQVEGVDPSLVYQFGDPADPQMNINLYKLVGRLVGAVQQLTERIEELEGEP